MNISCKLLPCRCETTPKAWKRRSVIRLLHVRRATCILAPVEDIRPLLLPWISNGRNRKPDFPLGTFVKRDTHLVILLLLVIGCSLASLTIWKVLSSRDRALEEVNVHGLNLTQALETYSEGIVRQSSLLLLGLVERLETEGYDRYVKA